jgi:serine/threonine protein kinase
MFTGRLPFESKDAMALVHGHIATLPVAAHEIAPRVPLQLSLMITKLLAKAADERYQTAWGLAEDLDECLRRLDTDGRITPFPLARFDRRTSGGIDSSARKGRGRGQSVLDGGRIFRYWQIIARPRIAKARHSNAWVLRSGQVRPISAQRSR